MKTKTVQTTIPPAASLIEPVSKDLPLRAGDFGYARLKIIGFAEGLVVVQPVTKKRAAIGDAAYYMPPEAVIPVGVVFGETKGKA